MLAPCAFDAPDIAALHAADMPSLPASYAALTACIFAAQENSHATACDVALTTSSANRSTSPCLIRENTISILTAAYFDSASLPKNAFTVSYAGLRERSMRTIPLLLR